MGIKFKNLFLIVLILLIGFKLAQSFVYLEFLTHSISFFALICLILSFCLMGLRKMLLPIFLCLLALLISVIYPNVSLTDVIWQGLREMSSMVVIITVVPIVSLVLRQDNYINNIIIFSSKILDSSTRFYTGTILITQMIGCFLLPTSIPITYQFISDFLKSKFNVSWEHLKSTAILRGFALIAFWAVSIPSFAYAVEVFQVPITVAVAHGFFISFCGVVLSVTLYHFYERKGESRLTEEIKQTIEKNLTSETLKTAKYKSIEFFLLLISLLGLILVITVISPWGLLTVMPLVVMVWTISFFVIKKRVYDFWLEFKNYINSLPLKTKEVSIFLSSGLVISAINSTPIGMLLIETMYKFTDILPGINFLFLLPFVVAPLGFVGMPPVASMVLVVSILHNFALPYPTFLIVLSLTVGSFISIMLSPFTIPGVLLSGANGQTSIKNTLLQNKLFTILFFLIVQFYIQLLLKLYT
ncbi:hypothetical protein [Alkalihalobacterium alkalinitrilicum]|uniref:hypothetical protein n=1 Tax=Alkalihalobacterium alkalinitrilicum TaxID=427920 RepID=UPI000994B49D|nr:hypothetical protein [Alkalihalobacterium alkalinitrilicum]